MTVRRDPETLSHSSVPSTLSVGMVMGPPKTTALYSRKLEVLKA